MAQEHGFTGIAAVQIQDENGSMTLPVEGGRAACRKTTWAQPLPTTMTTWSSPTSRATPMAGYGGAIKNISIGPWAAGKAKAGSTPAALAAVCGAANRTPFWRPWETRGKSVSDALGHGARIVYLNVMNRLSVGLRLRRQPRPSRKWPTSGILASTDPVALDQACIDLVYAAPGHEALTQRIESRNGIHTLESAEAIGLGSRAYRLELLDV